MSWEPDTFEIARPSGPHRVAGYTYRGLGLYMGASPKGRRPPIWLLTHLGSGHRICTLKGTVATAFPVATEIAEAGEWEFLSLVGWKDRFPDAPEKVREICERHARIAIFGNSSHSPEGEAVARQIASNRP